MGLNMDNIHNPSVPSGPTINQDTSKGEGPNKVSLMDLMAQKEGIEAELSALGSVLDSVRLSYPFLDIYYGRILIRMVGYSTAAQ